MAVAYVAESRMVLFSCFKDVIPPATMATHLARTLLQNWAAALATNSMGIEMSRWVVVADGQKRQR